MTQDDHMGITPPVALWALTPNGAELALKLSDHLNGCSLGGCRVFLSKNPDVMVKSEGKQADIQGFDTLKQTVNAHFHEFTAHVFFMATGIVVRMIAPWIVHKTKDPAVVVVDDQGHFSISLLSGHIGGANMLAARVATVLEAIPVITTASDVNSIESVDMMAVEKNLMIENPEWVKQVNMAFLTGKPVGLHDPYGVFGDKDGFDRSGHHAVRVFIDDRTDSICESGLVLRPKILVVGIGCNRGTSTGEIRDLLVKILEDHHLSPLSIGTIASVDVKGDELAILDLADELDVRLDFFSSDELKTVDGIETPSEMVEKHMGVKSVCEAAAILGAARGTLIVPKHKSQNATVAIARMSFTS